MSCDSEPLRHHYIRINKGVLQISLRHRHQGPIFQKREFWENSGDVSITLGSPVEGKVSSTTCRPSTTLSQDRYHLKKKKSANETKECVTPVGFPAAAQGEKKGGGLRADLRANHRKRASATAP